MTRARMPERRIADTRELVFDNVRFTVTVGVYPDGRPGEVFARGARAGSQLDGLIDDACVVVSRLLQHGEAAVIIQNALGRDGDRPASVIGAIADIVAEIDREVLR
ncbi:MAG: ribonucleotide reductase [Alphaproteobacteria bacterium]|nr:ribonucleotide reductase [Alphaproteobacteria bacterium]